VVGSRERSEKLPNIQINPTNPYHIPKPSLINPNSSNKSLSQINCIINSQQTTHDEKCKDNPKSNKKKNDKIKTRKLNI
jgi:hypothetical protein